jgi:hypothetical protein
MAVIEPNTLLLPFVPFEESAVAPAPPAPTVKVYCVPGVTGYAAL